MALQAGERILEVTTTTGTSSVSLLGNISGFQTFASGVGAGNTCYYGIIHQDLGNNPEWEVGIGTFNTGPDTLTRDTVLDSNLGPGNKTSFSSGYKNVFVTLPATKAIQKDANDRVGIGVTSVTDTDNLLYVAGDIKASGINAGSGIILERATAPDPNTDKLYNVGGTLYWAGNQLGGAGGLFSIEAGSGLSQLTVQQGSGLRFIGGENVVTSLEDTGNGSGVVTISVPNIDTNLNITAQSGLTSLNLGFGSGLFIKAGNNIGTELTDGGNGSGIITIHSTIPAAYTAGTGIQIDSNNVIGAVSGSLADLGVLRLHNTVESGVQHKALTPGAVFSAGYMNSFNVAGSAGNVLSLSDGSGLAFATGGNITALLTDQGDGSGVITFTGTDTTYTVASGIVMDGDNVIRHQDTSTQSSVNNTGNFFIQDITLDTYGHITALTSVEATGVGTRFFLGGSDGIGTLKLEDGSGLHIVGGSNVNVTLSDAGNGSGVITIDSPTAVGINTDGSATPAASGLPIFSDSDSVYYDGRITWDSGASPELILDGNISLQPISAPSPTANRLYNVGGDLTWNGVNLLTGGSATGITSVGSPTPVASGVPFFTGSNTLGYDEGLIFDSGNKRLGINTINAEPHSTLQVYGSIATKVKGVVDDYTAADEYSIIYDGTNKAGTGVITLPDATASHGRIYTISNVGTNPSGVTVVPAGSDTIDGSLTEERLWVQNDSLTLLASSGTNGNAATWHAVNREYTPHSSVMHVSRSGMTIPWNATSRVYWGDVRESMPSGMVNRKEDPTFSLGTVHASGNGIEVLRDGYYKISAKVNMGTGWSGANDRFYMRFDILSKFNDNEEAWQNIPYFGGEGNHTSLERIPFATRWFYLGNQSFNRTLTAEMEEVYWIPAGYIVSVLVNPISLNLGAKSIEDQQNVHFGDLSANRVGFDTWLQVREVR